MLLPAPSCSAPEVIPLLFGGGNRVRYVFRRRERRFKAEAVRKHLREFAEGDARPAEWEVQTRAINEDNLSVGSDLKNRYRVYERWGYLTGAELRGSGAELPEEDDDKVFSANVWLLGDTLP